MKRPEEKKKPKKLAMWALCLAALLPLLSLAACGQGRGNAETEQLEGRTANGGDRTYVVTHWTGLPEEITGVSRFLVQDGKAWICCQETTAQADADGAAVTASYVASMALDGSGFARFPAGPAFQPLDIAVDAQGNIWSVGFAGDALTLAQFDADGNTRKTISLADSLEEKIPRLPGIAGFFLCNDASGNLCVTVRYMGTYAYVFDPEGRFLFHLEQEGNPLTAITTGEGKIAICVSRDGGWNYSLFPIDTDRQAWGEKLSLGAASMVYGGAGQYAYYLYDSSDFYGCSAEDGTRDLLFNWSKLGLSAGGAHVCPCADGRFAVVSVSFHQTGLGACDFCYVEPGVDTRTILTMLSLQPNSSLLEAVAQFNKRSERYRVELISYFSFSEDVSDGEWEKALLKFHTELISGKAPDIIDLDHMPVEAYCSRGILEDLYPYIQNDPSIQEEAFFDGVFETMKINGRLPYVTNSVIVQTILADARTVRMREGWTMSDFIHFLDQNGEKAIEAIAPSGFLTTMVGINNPFVDWTNGTCSFDSREFVELLEVSKRVGSGQELYIINGIANHPVTAAFAAASSVFAVAQYNTLFAGNVNPIGYPNESGAACHILLPNVKIGISAASAHKEGAWEFARSFLEERQQDASFFFPIRKSSFEKIASAALRGNSIWSFVYERKLVQEDVNLARELLNSVRFCYHDNELTQIIMDGAAPYFTGDRSAQEAATQIQARAQLYVYEQR